MQYVLDPFKSDFLAQNHIYLEVFEFNWGGSEGIRKLGNKATTFMRMPKSKSHYRRPHKLKKWLNNVFIEHTKHPTPWGLSYGIMVPYIKEHQNHPDRAWHGHPHGISQGAMGMMRKTTELSYFKSMDA